MFVPQRKNTNPWSVWLLCSWAALVGAVAGRCGAQPGGAPSRAEHEIETAAAWEALLAKDYKAAIRRAERVIDKYAPAAFRLQQQIAEARQAPPVGVVTREEAEAIHRRGPLNDCAAAFFIRGRAAHALGLAGKARESFQEAAKLDGARVWDADGGFFWAVAPVARRSLDDPQAAEKPEHEILTGDAWAAFNRGDYRTAIDHADACLERYLSAANRLQDRLTRRRETFAEGAVSEAEKRRIFANGLLNDACTCLFIQGQAAEKIGDIRLAISAYERAAVLTHARCWDPQGWFWDPSQACRDRLEVLK